MKRFRQYFSRRWRFCPGDALLAFLFLLSLGLIIWGIDIYRLTVIEAKFLIAATTVGAFISVVVIFLLQTRRLYTVWTFFISIAIGAGFFFFALLYLNRTLGEKETLTEEFVIIRSGSLARGKYGSCRRPYVIINFYGVGKQLLFYCEYEKTVKGFSKVMVTYSRGLFGFDVIASKQLIK